MSAITLSSLPGCTFLSHDALAETVRDCVAVQGHIDELKHTGDVMAFTVAMMARGEFEVHEIAKMARSRKRIPTVFACAGDFAIVTI